MDTHDIKLALQGPAMNTYMQEDFLEVVRIHVDRAYTLAEAQKPIASVYEQVVKEIADKILRSYGYITSQELALVCEAGVAGELGRQTKPTAGAFFSWLAAYLDSDLRKETVREMRRSVKAGPQELTGEEKERANRISVIKSICYLWEEYRIEGKILAEHQDGWCAMAFDGLMERGLFRLPDECWEQAREQARSMYRRQQQKVKTIGSLMEDYTPIFKTKRILLAMCFKSAVKAGMDITAILDKEIENIRNGR